MFSSLKLYSYFKGLYLIFISFKEGAPTFPQMAFLSLLFKAAVGTPSPDVLTHDCAPRTLPSSLADRRPSAPCHKLCVFCGGLLLPLTPSFPGQLPPILAWQFEHSFPRDNFLNRPLDEEASSCPWHGCFLIVQWVRDLVYVLSLNPGTVFTHIGAQ